MLRVVVGFVEPLGVVQVIFVNEFERLLRLSPKVFVRVDDGNRHRGQGII